MSLHTIAALPNVVSYVTQNIRFCSTFRRVWKQDKTIAGYQTTLIFLRYDCKQFTKQMLLISAPSEQSVSVSVRSAGMCTVSDITL